MTPYACAGHEHCVLVPADGPMPEAGAAEASGARVSVGEREGSACPRERRT